MIKPFLRHGAHDRGAQSAGLGDEPWKLSCALWSVRLRFCVKPSGWATGSGAVSLWV